jgi:hypothetical protein
MRSPLRLILAAALLASVAPLAHASALPAALAVTADGRVLRAGSVVATGRLSGGRCLFGSATAVILRSAATGGVALRADGACRLVVTALGAPTRSSAGVTFYSAAPKAGADTPYVVTGSGIPGGDLLGSDLGIDTANATVSVHVALSQSVYDAVGSLQYEDKMEVAYLRNTKNGNVTHLTATDGYCRGAGIADNPVNTWTGVAATEIRDCFYKPSATGPDKVGFVTGGYYRQVLLGIERDARGLSETYSESRTGTVAHTCNPGGSLPQYWSTYCFLNRVA